MRHIRDKFGNILYCIRDNGTITDKFDCNVVGYLKNDRIIDKFNINTIYRIRPDGTITDKHDCDVIGHIREDGSITDEYDIHKCGSVDVATSSTSDTRTSFSGGIFTLIFGTLGAILGFVVYKAIPFLFTYVIAPDWVGRTWIIFVGIMFLGIGVEPVALAFAYISIICQLAFYPYWIMLIVYRVKKQITTKTMLSFYWKWFLKGPFAYKNIITLKKGMENN